MIELERPAGSARNVGANASAPAASREQKLEMLEEWRDALIAIVDADPGAVETRKAIVDIEARIADLGD